MSGIELKQRLAAILAADVAGYSRLMSVDERATVAALDAARAVFRKQIESNQGRVIDMAGDSVLAVFETATGAISAALAVQQEIDNSSTAVTDERRMRFRIGIHLGDVIEKADGTVYGDGVNIAARLEGLAEPGGITISEAVRSTIRGKVTASFVDQGEQQVKNIPHPVRVYRLRVGIAPDIAARPAPSLSESPSIAVLAFTNISGETEQEYFADGLVEEIITALSRYRWLFVIARNSSFTYKGRAVEIRQVGRELGVRYILEGSVRKAANRVRITGQLIDTASGAHIWADRYDRDLSDVFEIQDEITSKIVGALAPELTAAEIARARHKRPDSFNAWDAYVRALPLMREHTKDSNARAVQFLRKAVEHSPNFAAAYARLSACRTQAAYFGWDGRGDGCIAEALELARRSQALDPEEPLAFDALGSAYQILGDNENAVTLARRALELSPTCTAAYGTLVSALAFLGHSEAALEVFARSERTSPRDPDRSSRLLGLAIAYFVAERYDESITAAEGYVGVRPNWYGGYILLAASHALAGRSREAHLAAQRILELIPQFTLTRARRRPMFSRPSDAEMLFDGLQRAGIPA